MPTDADRMRAKRARTYGVYDKARNRALVRLSQSHPSEYKRLLADELEIATRAAERAAR